MHPDDESLIINYDPGSEMVSLPGGAEPTSTKKEALVFEDQKRGLNSDSSTTVSSNPNFQNPIYGTSQFDAAPNLSQDRTLFNPVYEAVPFAEKTPASDGDEKAPSDVPEKVMPSAEDFMAHDDAKPLVATTTATGTTTVHGNGEKYEPATPVPIEVQNEPMYATVMPKHKRATAKPFAADGDESDSD